MRNIVVILVSIITFSSCTKEIIQYKLTTSSTPITGGTVIPTSSEYEKGSNVSITATPAGEYLFKEWQGSLTGTNNPTSILIDSDKQVTSVFEKRQYPLNLVVEGNGAIKEEVIAIATQSQYPSGTTVRLTPTAATNWQFKGWEGDIVSADAILEIKVLKAVSLKAVFVRKEYPLNLTIEGNGSVKEEIISVATQSLYPAGTTVKLTAKPNVGSEFSDWSGDIISKDSVITVNVLNAINIKARFKDFPTVPVVNQQLYPDLNWNNHAQNKNRTFDVNNDGVPDIVSSTMDLTLSSPKPAKVKILDYSGKTILDFDILKYKPTIRDSLNNVYIDYADINKDGYLDLAVNYMGEWPKTGRFITNNAFLLLSKNSFNYDVVEVWDNKNEKPQFNANLFDWDSDGLIDILFGWYNDGIYYKNMGNNKFEKRNLVPQFYQLMGYKSDFDNDGELDFVNFYIKQFDENGYSMNGDGKSQVLSILSKKGLKQFDVVGKTLPKTFNLTPGNQTYERLTLVDGDLDGDKDLVLGSLIVGQPVSNTNNGWVYHQEYFENTGSQFEFRKNYIELDDKNWGELQVWAQDLDGDGDEDLFYPTYKMGSPDYFWWENTGKGFKINKKFKLNKNFGF